MRLDLGQDDHVMGAKRHGRRSGAHDKKLDQHLDWKNAGIGPQIKSKRIIFCRYLGSELLSTYCVSIRLTLSQPTGELSDFLTFFFRFLLSP